MKHYSTIRIITYRRHVHIFSFIIIKIFLKKNLSLVCFKPSTLILDAIFVKRFSITSTGKCLLISDTHWSFLQCVLGRTTIIFNAFRPIFNAYIRKYAPYLELCLRCLHMWLNMFLLGILLNMRGIHHSLV